MTTQPEGTIEAINLQNLSDKTMFLNLEFNRFGNSRKVDVEVNTDANQSRFNHSKQLLNSPELKEIARADAALRIWIDAPTRCWRYGGSMRLVPLSVVEEVRVTCKNYETITRPSLIKAFVDTYLSYVADAKKELGSQFNQGDYPSVETVEQEFSFKYQFLSFSTPEKLKLISPELYEEEKEKAHQTLMSAAEDLRAGMRAVFQDMLEGLLEVLKPEIDGKKKRLHGSKIVKLQEFLNTFDLRNVTDDLELQGQVTKLKMLMEGVSVDQVKESDNLKADMVAKFSEVSSNLKTLVQATGRKFR